MSPTASNVNVTSGDGSLLSIGAAEVNPAQKTVKFVTRDILFSKPIDNFATARDYQKFLLNRLGKNKSLLASSAPLEDDESLELLSDAAALISDHALTNDEALAMFKGEQRAPSGDVD